jgi:hypothetical protein
LVEEFVAGMTKLYAYTDESGAGAIPFVVAVVVVHDDRDVLSDVCQQVETESGKGRTKWAKANYDKRLTYVRAIVNDVRFRGALCFVSFEQVTDYDTATVSAIARAIERADPNGQQKVAVFVDGLNDKKQREYSALLRQQVESFVNVRGIKRDESSPLIRLADALAGFVRDAQGEHSEGVVVLFERAQRTGAIVAV